MISQIGFLPRKCPLLFTEFKSLIPTSRHIKCMSPFALGQKGNGVWLKTRTEGLIWTNGGLYTRLRKKEGGKTCTVWGIIPWHTNLFSPIPLPSSKNEGNREKNQSYGDPKGQHSQATWILAPLEQAMLRGFRSIPVHVHPLPLFFSSYVNSSQVCTTCKQSLLKNTGT